MNSNDAELFRRIFRGRSKFISWLLLLTDCNIVSFLNNFNNFGEKLLCNSFLLNICNISSWCSNKNRCKNCGIFWDRTAAICSFSGSYLSAPRQKNHPAELWFIPIFSWFMYSSSLFHINTVFIVYYRSFIFKIEYQIKNAESAIYNREKL